MNKISTFKKQGQAMMELVFGLVSIVILIMGINLIASVVYEDFTTIFSARELVADQLMAGSNGSKASGGIDYDFEGVRKSFEDALNPGNVLDSRLREFPSSREKPFDFLWTKDNPLQEMASSELTTLVPITSPLFQQVTGKNSVKISNAAYMPPWEDLLK